MALGSKKLRLPKLGNPPVDKAKVFLVPSVWGVTDPKFVEQIKVLCEDHVFDAGVHLDALFDRVVPGAMVILDDYEWAGVYRGQKLAEDPWFEAREYRVFPLPTGQGFVIKR